MNGVIKAWKRNPCFNVFFVIFLNDVEFLHFSLRKICYVKLACFEFCLPLVMEIGIVPSLMITGQLGLGGAWVLCATFCTKHGWWWRLLSSSTPVLKTFKEGGCPASPGQPVLMLCHPYSTQLYPQRKTASPPSSLKVSCFIWCLLPWGTTVKNLLGQCWKLSKAGLLILSSAQVLRTLVPLCCTHLVGFVDAFPVWGSPELDSAFWTVALGQLDGYQL